ncbi:MAG: hypothetical protein ACKVQK_30120 [Burkholderiales bacterium]
MSNLSAPLESKAAIRLSDLTFERPIPKAVRDYGSALDLKLLEPGDLLLFSKKEPSWIDRGIIKIQGRAFASEHSRWHHAAVSGGGVEICEATRAGVNACEYWPYMTGEYDIKLRRLKDANAETRSRIAYYAATHVRINYGYWNLPALAKSLSNGNPWATRSWFSKGVICSQLYFEACMRAGFLLANIPSEQVCPAQLSITTQMEDIALKWVRV